jgi:histone-lysine N-methyltransferase MLL3
VHSQCDPEANEQTFLEKRATQYNYMYTCKVCKGQAQRAATMTSGNTSGSLTPSITSPRDHSDDAMTPESKAAWATSLQDNSFEDDDSLGARGSLGMGRGKPMSALAGKKKKLGLLTKPRLSGISKPDVGSSPTGNHPGSSPPMSIIDKKRANEVRRRGRQPKIRGMVGLQRPQAEPGAKEDPEEDSKMICVSVNDDFVLKQDICVMCGAIGTDLEGRLIACTQCGECYHPHCINVRVTKVILQKGWRCLDCTVCEGCGLKHDEANLILCDECSYWYLEVQVVCYLSSMREQ